MSTSLKEEARLLQTEGPQTSDHSPNQKRKKDGSISEILLAFLIVSVPLSVLAAALLALVLNFRLLPTNLSSEQGLDSSSYYVDLSATRIALIASYSSTIASFVIGSAMLLVSYPLSAKFARYSQSEDLEHLPTPYQIGLLINLRTGSFGSLWPWFKYTVRQKIRRKTSGVVKASAIAVILALFVT